MNRPRDESRPRQAMLSPGRWYERVPRERVANLRWRRAVLLAARSDGRLRRGLIEVCKRDILFWINSFVWTFDPRKPASQKVQPFVTYDFQDRALLGGTDPATGERVYGILNCVECRCGEFDGPHQHDLVIEKSRDMGASWLCLLAEDWLCQFRDWQKWLMISRNANAVDQPDDPDCLFWKIDFAHQHLPGWLRPAVVRRKMGFRYTASRSTVTGQATTGKAGVGGRGTGMFIDEFAQIDEDYSVLHRTSDTTGCRIFNSTHLGVGTAFFDMLHGSLSKALNVKRLQMHWSQHPEKNRGLYRSGVGPAGWEPIDKAYDYPPDFAPVTDGRPHGGPFPGVRSPWYDRECARKGNPRAISMDLDCDAQGSASQFFDAATIHTLRAAATPPLWEGDLDYDRDSARPRRLVRREGGRLRLWFLPDSRGLPPPGKYAAGADIALGTGATPSVLAIGNADLRPSEVVGEYANPLISAEDFACLSVALCRLFHDALFCWEHAGPSGSMFTREVTEVWHYGNVYYRPASPDGVRSERSDKPGFVPNPKLTALLLESFRNATATGRLLVHSDEMLAECLAFQFNKRGDRVFHGESENTDDPTKATVNHGDRVIAGALLWKMLDQLGAREGETARAARTQPEYLTSAWLHAERDRRRRLAQSAWGRAAYLRRR